MAREKSVLGFSGSLEVEVTAPLDARTVVPLKADMTDAGSFPYAYEGLTVYVAEEKKSYTLTGTDTTDPANWKEVGSGGGGQVDVDAALSKTSTNPVQNKVITVEVHSIQSAIATIQAAQAMAAGNIAGLRSSVAKLEVGSASAQSAITAIEAALERLDREKAAQSSIVVVQSSIATINTAIANRYTKTETDAKIAEAMTDVDNEHFHPVTVLPNPADEDPTKRPKDNHEYILIEYEQDGTTIKSETHYLFYGGAYHQKSTGGISLDGYATEQYVDNEFAQHVKTDVPVNAVFTDTVYDDTALSARVTEVEGKHIELTQAQYTALPEEEKMNGKVYFITDGGTYVPAIDLIPHGNQAPIVVGKLDIRGDGEFRDIKRVRLWISDLKNASGIITAGWVETGVYVRPICIYGWFTFHEYESTQTGFKTIIQQFPIPYSGYEPIEAPSDEKIGLKFYVNHNNKLRMVVDGKSYFNQDDFACVIVDFMETPIT